MANANETSPATESYVLAPSADIGGTHHFAEVELVPAEIVRCFGPGQESDGYKVSREWVFRKDELIFTLYDWKSTDLYDSELWSPEQLWISKLPFEFHIGSKAPASDADVCDFIAYLQRVTSR